MPVLMYVLARSNLTEMLLNVEYMMELMDPALQLGEGESPALARPWATGLATEPDAYHRPQPSPGCPTQPNKPFPDARFHRAVGTRHGPHVGAVLGGGGSQTSRGAGPVKRSVTTS